VLLAAMLYTSISVFVKRNILYRL